MAIPIGANEPERCEEQAKNTIVTPPREQHCREEYHQSQDHPRPIPDGSETTLGIGRVVFHRYNSPPFLGWRRVVELNRRLAILTHRFSIPV
jgi:hypothetical protein